MRAGTVKWYNGTKGFGLIVDDAGGPDVFVHHTAIQAEGLRTLAAGQRVTFDTVKTDERMNAANVRLID